MILIAKIDKKLQRIKTVVTNTFLHTRKMKNSGDNTAEQSNSNKSTLTLGSLIVSEYKEQQQQQENAATISRSSSGANKSTLVSIKEISHIYKEDYEEEEEEGHSFTSTLLLPDENDRYSSYSESSASAAAFSEEENKSLKEEEDGVAHQNAYSNFYVKLPNGNWLVRYRTRDGKVLTSYEIKSCMI